MDRCFAAAVLLGLLVMACAVVETMGQGKTTSGLPGLEEPAEGDSTQKSSSTLPELEVTRGSTEEGTQATTAPAPMKEEDVSSEATAKEEESAPDVAGKDDSERKAFITVCAPPHPHFYRRHGHHSHGHYGPHTHHVEGSYTHEVVCAEGSVCTKLENRLCGPTKECKDVFVKNCTEYKTFYRMFGSERYSKKKCVKYTTETLRVCREYEVCTHYACISPEPPVASEAPSAEALSAEPPSMATATVVPRSITLPIAQSPPTETSGTSSTVTKRSSATPIAGR